MKLSATTARTFTAVHGWAGIVAGFLLFIAFYAGSLTLFQREIGQWTASAMGDHATTPDDAQRLLDTVLAQHSSARAHMGMILPGDTTTQPVAYWFEHGRWLLATPEHPQGSPELPSTALPELIKTLHYSLGIPGVGMWLMGVASLLYGVALVSGLVIHLPRLVKDFLALRPGHNLKRFWQDAHTVIGVVILPFHVVFAVTGALLCLLPLLVATIDPLAFAGKLAATVPEAMNTAPRRVAAQRPAPLAPLARWQARAIDVARQRGVTDFRPVSLKLAQAGDAQAVVEITGHADKTLGSSSAVALDAITGALLSSQLPDRRDANHATLSLVRAFHFAEYGNSAVRWLYFLLGLGGAFLFYSGNLLWIESRRKRRKANQGRAQVAMAKATVGICLGLCVAISAGFVAAQVLPALHASDSGVAHAEHGVCYGVWALCALWAAMRPPARAAPQLLNLAALLSAAAALVHGAATGLWPWRSAATGAFDQAAIDLLALALAVAFARAAWLTARRARTGDPHSVWAWRGEDAADSTKFKP